VSFFFFVGVPKKKRLIGRALTFSFPRFLFYLGRSRAGPLPARTERQWFTRGRGYRLLSALGLFFFQRSAAYEYTKSLVFLLQVLKKAKETKRVDGLDVWCCVIRWFKPRPTNARLSTLFFFFPTVGWFGAVLFHPPKRKKKKTTRAGAGPSSRGAAVGPAAQLIRAVASLSTCFFYFIFFNSAQLVFTGRHACFLFSFLP